MTRKLGLSSDWISARFRDERARLALTHAEVGKVAGVSRNSVAAWEKETSIPADALALLSEVGFDPQYVIIGVRSRNALAIGEPQAEYLAPEVTAEEWKLLRQYRALSDAQRDQARAMMQVLKVGMPMGGNTTIVSGAGSARVAGRDIVKGSKSRSKR
jgi:DNA-binding XRE family transcriptional regulator